ncbi:MAG: hypothetical protein O3C43_06415 [Verrucomicrobia bacterium]|nr:hypothetical protein [Verrucomicrobiota bacterium]MDA1066120.1 hypothetical protein [Verrucomicrobiota bacterium]
MWPYSPIFAHLPPTIRLSKTLPFVHNEEAVNPELQAEDQALLTRWATESALKFIDQNRGNPFPLLSI